MTIKTLLDRQHFLALNLTIVLLLSFSVIGVVSAQEETPEGSATEVMAEMPDILVDGIDELSEEFPDILDLEWVEYSDREITMWLQDGFEPVLVEDLLEVAEQGMSLVDPQLQPFVQMLMANPELIRFVAMNSDTVSSGFVTNIIVIRERSLFEIDAIEVAQAAVNLLPDSVTVREEPAEFEMEGFDNVASAQWNLETVVTDVVSLVYIIVDGDYIYTINVSTIPERADSDQALAELALQTLLIERDEDEE